MNVTFRAYPSVKVLYQNRGLHNFKLGQKEKISPYADVCFSELRTVCREQSYATARWYPRSLRLFLSLELGLGIRGLHLGLFCWFGLALGKYIGL